MSDETIYYKLPEAGTTRELEKLHKDLREFYERLDNRKTDREQLEGK